MAGTLKTYRRTALAAGVVGLAVIATAVSGPGVESAAAGTPATPQTAGQASAIAQSYKVDPRTAALSLGISFGVSLAGYTNNVAQAESRGIDLGIIGSTLSAQGCDGGDPTLPAEDQPIPLHADSRDKDASQTKQDQEKYVPLITKTVRADSTPFAEASTSTAGLSASGSVVSIDGVKSRATTRLNNGNREAIAVSDVGSFGIAGIVELAGLKWSATSTTGAVDSNVGSFTIGALKVLGLSLPVNDSAKAIENANTLLAPLGIAISYPRVHIAAGILFVDPLRISVVPSAQRDRILATVLGALLPVKQSLYDYLLEQDCGNKTYILVSDIAIGSVTGAGSLSLELGGVQTKSEVLKTSNFLGGNLSSSLNDGFTAGSLGSTTNDLPLFNDVPAISGSPTGPTKTNTGKTNRPAALAASTEGKRGGKMAMVGGLGLLALLIVADRDRRLMRRAQRLIPTEA